MFPEGTGNGPNVNTSALHRDQNELGFVELDATLLHIIARHQLSFEANLGVAAILLAKNSWIFQNPDVCRFRHKLPRIVLLKEAPPSSPSDIRLLSDTNIAEAGLPR